MFALSCRWFALFTVLLATTALAQNGNDSAGNQADEQPRWYRVEVVIFANQGGNAGPNPEQWRKDLALAYPANWQALQPLEDSDSDAPQAFATLPSEQWQLAAAADALGRQNGFTVLFHEAWDQPLTAAEQAPAIVVQGGQQFGEQRELLGTLRLHVARFLHLETDLWFSEYVTNYGQAPEPWPVPPAHPDQETPSRPGDSFLLDSGGDNWQALPGLGQHYDAILDTPYRLDRVVTLRQRRKMRSGELHYIDHPLAGVLIQLTPLEWPPEPTEADPPS